MKNKLPVRVLLALITCVALMATGCATTEITRENQGNFGENVRTPVKDFESRGLVFTETQLMTSYTATQGQIFTYQALLQEAHKLGADAIINVVIDKKTQTTDTNLRETWYGSALAIKYTDTLRQTENVIVTNNGTITTETTSVYFNDGIIADTGKQNVGKQSTGIFGGLFGRAGKNDNGRTGTGGESAPRGVRQ